MAILTAAQMPATFDPKKLRSEVIARHITDSGLRGAVCFSCGNASRALQVAGVDVVDVSPGGALIANTWWRPHEIARIWPDRFDATSGHLPLWMMERIGREFRRFFGGDRPPTAIPTGSGETVVCLALAYPGLTFTAVYDDSHPATTFNNDAPLNAVVRALCDVTRLV